MDKDFYFRVETMRKRPQKITFGASAGRDRDRNEIAIASSEEKSTEIEKPEKNCGLFHMEKENKEINELEKTTKLIYAKSTCKNCGQNYIFLLWISLCPV